jgi:hypothetical protein
MSSEKYTRDPEPISYRGALLSTLLLVVVYVSSQFTEVVGSRPDEVNEFSSILIILPGAVDPGAYSACNGNEYQKQKNNVSVEQNAAGAWG